MSSAQKLRLRKKHVARKQIQHSPRHPELVPPVWGGDPVSLVLVDNNRFLSRSSRSPLSLISDSPSAVTAAAAPGAAAADVSDCFFFFKRKTFSAEVLGHESIPFFKVLFLNDVFAQLLKILATLVSCFECYRFFY